MALLPNDPQDQKKFLGVILALAALAAFYLYVYTPKDEELAETRARVEDVERLNELAELRSGGLETLRRELRRREAVFAALEELVPARSEVPALYEAIATEANDLDLELVAVTPSEPQRSEDGAYYLRQTWSMTVTGEFHSIAAFLTRVASFPRIVRPQVAAITPIGRTTSGRQEVQAEFELDTYVLPPETERTEGTDEGARAD